ncbi:MAG: hypothetical protein A3H91_17390 [Gammaproteobacteria bacterium RIFCSPLOWO2_02_FULL_61_13]|nr:MAG: hypothetical protein A3H91_17390 [Gammaproteobacteria bacterium RIFCSPLOWO2_02_FULL_61_13]
MSRHITLRPIAAALGTTFAVSLALSPIASAEQNPFSLTELSGGYMVADSHAEGSCGEGKKEGEAMKEGEGKCGEGKDTSAEGKCGEGKCGEKRAAHEGKCGEGKCGEGKEKKAEGSCGEGMKEAEAGAGEKKE